MDFLDVVTYLRRQGIKNVDIAKGMKMTTTDLRTEMSIQKHANKQADINMARRLHDKGMSPSKIGIRMAQNGVPRNESSIRALLEPGAKDKNDQLMNIANMLKREVADKKYIQVGVGVSNSIGVTDDKLKIAVAVLVKEGYAVHKVQVPQLGTSVGNKSTLKVLCPPGTKYADVKTHTNEIRNIKEYTKDSGRTMLGIVPPLQINSKRIKINYAEDGGGDLDGVIYVRPGVKDVSMGSARYAQVRIAVDGTHYLKGMAMYKDDLPKGVDLVFNTPKSRTDPKYAKDKLAVMKKNDEDPENPFKSFISRQIGYKDKDDNLVLTSAMNLVNEEGAWQKWSKKLPAQMLSKQPAPLAREQLGKRLAERKADLDTIMSLTNPTVRKKLLETFAAGADASAVHLEAKAFKDQAHHILLPINGMKVTEVFAPNYNNGTRVSLIRFPHGGTFEIPELIVNNKNPEARRLLDGAKDAVGINSEVAKRLSGADFDGDTVLVIPNNSRKVKSTRALDGLANFDPIREYPEYEGMKLMTAHTKGVEMGKISNLITDMTIKNAPAEEMVHAIKHSMVVIDAEKKKLDFRRSALDNGISGLKTKYQKTDESNRRGAATLLSRSNARKDVPTRRARRAKDGGPVDKTTGELKWTPKNETYPETKIVKDRSTGKAIIDPATGKPLRVPTGKIITRTKRSDRMSETTDAHTLSSGTLMESIYADHANGMKSLANEARRVAINTDPVKYNRAARIAYQREVDSLNAKLSIAVQNKPLERQAQALANGNLEAVKQSNPDMTPAQIKKIQYRLLEEARTRSGAEKKPVEITDNEWDAIQAGAITNHNLEGILNNADLEKIKERAMPRPKLLMTNAKKAKAKLLLERGFTRAEVAGALGVSLTTLRVGLEPPTEGG
jgi:hypothetical protein